MSDAEYERLKRFMGFFYEWFSVKPSHRPESHPLVVLRRKWGLTPFVLSMDYFNEAFGGFQPDSDEDAALKFSLCVLALDNRMDELLHLVKSDDEVGGIEGDPGWIIERRDVEDIGGYGGWPEGARFRAFVDPESYSLGFPEFYVDRQTFARYVAALTSAYKRRNPERVDVVTLIETALAGG